MSLKDRIVQLTAPPVEGPGSTALVWLQRAEIVIYVLLFTCLSSGLVYFRGNGRIFYFCPGHEAYPIFYDENVRLVLKNAVKWAATDTQWVDECPNVPVDQAPEPITRQGEGLHQDGDEGFR